jgi:hypothetical protein
MNYCLTYLTDECMYRHCQTTGQGQNQLTFYGS